MDGKVRQDERAAEEAIDEASRESFPASDPPATTPGHPGEPAEPTPLEDERNRQKGLWPKPGDEQAR